MPKLDLEIRQLLAELELVSEARARNPEPQPSAGKPEDRAPPGFKEGRGWADLRQAPDDDFLYEHYRWRFDHARDDWERVRLLEEGRTALQLRVHGPSREQLIQLAKSEQENAAWILEHAEGRPASVVAAALNGPLTWVPAGWVRQIRQRANKDPETGRPRPPWGKLSEDERKVVCRNMKSEGNTVREAAKRLGVTKSTVGPYWPKERKRVRAA